MKENYSTVNEAIFFLAAIVLVFFITIAVWVNNVIPFMEERKYIKMEIKRSPDDRRCRYWKKKLKKLYLHSIPIIGRFFR